MNKLTDSLIDKIQKNCGIILTEDLQPSILEFVNRRLEELNINIESYYARLDMDKEEMEKLINASTVNETYFFRDEKQYDFLCNDYFASRNFSSVRIWCGACSTGEEPLSVYALAKHYGIEADITATDINTQVLNLFRKGIYSKKSFRTDGQKYHKLLQNFSTAEENCIQVNQDDINKIHISNVNLNSDSPLPFVLNCFDLIILRNIFIYFQKKTILNILSHVWSVLKPDGILLLSANEIASIPENEFFQKEKNGNVYYLKKKNTKSNSAAQEKNIFDEVKNILERANECDKENPFLSKTNYETRESSFKSGLDSYKEVLHYINNQNYKKAEEMISQIDFSSTDLEYKFFFTGLIRYQMNNFKEAESNFYKSSSLNQDFWPSTIMLAYTYKHIGKFKKSLSSFTHSLNILNEYVKSGKSCYNFTIDFDPAYIVTLCKRNIDEVKKSVGE